MGIPWLGGEHFATLRSQRAGQESQQIGLFVSCPNRAENYSSDTNAILNVHVPRSVRQHAFNLRGQTSAPSEGRLDVRDVGYRYFNFDFDERIAWIIPVDG